MPDDPDFEVAPGKELRQKYGLTAENRPTIRLDPARVPEQFRGWIPLAELWGIGDDLIREDCVHKATPRELRDLLSFGDAYDEVMSKWLAGPESCAPEPTEEYVAFTCLGLAWDLARVLKQKTENSVKEPHT